MSIAELNWMCDCHCPCCEDGYNYIPGDGHSTDEDNEYTDDDTKKRREMKCECTDAKRVALFQKYIDSFVFTSTFKDAALKRTFTSEVASFEKTLAAIDYHPGMCHFASRMNYE